MNIVTNEVDYQVNGISHRAYVAFNDLTSPPRPGILLVHEWWGLNDYMKKRAKMLAELGYVALAIDMYGEGRLAADPDEAGSLMNVVLGDMENGTRALQAGYQTLVDQPQVNADKTAAIGYCFGGAMALHMARIGLPLSAVVSFHGALGSFHTAAPGSIQPRVLVCHGEADTMVTMDDLAGFKQEMDTAQANYQVNVYPNAKHGFSNEAADGNGEKYGLDLGYNALADNKSWDAMEALFEEVFF
ncbi:MAG: dienelactone hydrolase family protein [Gammaproteobacteria bacterium]